MGDIAVEVDGGGGNGKVMRNWIVTQVTRVMISHTSLNQLLLVSNFTVRVYDDTSV